MACTLSINAIHSTTISIQFQLRLVCVRVFCARIKGGCRYLMVSRWASVSWCAQMKSSHFYDEFFFCVHHHSNRNGMHECHLKMTLSKSESLTLTIYSKWYPHGTRIKISKRLTLSILHVWNCAVACFDYPYLKCQSIFLFHWNCAFKCRVFSSTTSNELHLVERPRTSTGISRQPKAHRCIMSCTNIVWVENRNLILI